MSFLFIFNHILNSKTTLEKLITYCLRMMDPDWQLQLSPHEQLSPHLHPEAIFLSFTNLKLILIFSKLKLLLCFDLECNSSSLFIEVLRYTIYIDISIVHVNVFLSFLDFIIFATSLFFSY